jgi:hypothetical protein
MVKVRGNIITCLQDQPERRETLYLARGNSTYHGRFGFSMDTGQVRQVLVPCDECYTSLRDESMDKESEPKRRHGNCVNCSCWAYNIDHPLLRSKAPSDYPEDLLTQNGDNKIASFQLSFHLLREAMLLVHSHLVCGEWTSAYASAYLRRFVKQTTAIEQIIKCASNCHLMEVVKRHPDYKTSSQYIAG